MHDNTTREQCKRNKRLVAPATIVLFATNLAVYCLMTAANDGRLIFRPDHLLTWGANYAPLTMDGQWWRVFTCMFVHGGLLHIAFNLWILWQFGRLLECLVGSTNMLVLYLASGLFSSMAGLWFNPFVVIQGASGGLFGLLGGLFAFLLVNRQSLPPAGLRTLRNNCLVFLFVNLILALLIEQIDLVGHTAGLVAGFSVGLLLTRQTQGSSLRSCWRRATLASGFAMVLLFSAAHSAPPAPSDVYGEIARFTEVERECLRRYSETRQHGSHGELAKRTLVDLVDFELLPTWREAGKRITSIRRSPSELEEVLVKLELYIQVRQQSWELLVASIREDNQRKLAAHQETWSRAEQLARELSTKR